MPSILFIGGTGLISEECARLAIERRFDVTLLTRGKRPALEGTRCLIADISDTAAVKAVLQGRTFDAVADFIAYRPEDLQQRLETFTGRCGQFLHISTCACYQKPPAKWRITEDTPLENPFWKYAQLKIDAERIAMNAFAERQFPVTIVRPSHTYGDSRIPAPFHNSAHSWTIARRLLEGRPVIAHGDGAGLWQVTHAADFAAGFLGLVGNPKAIGEAFHITTDEVLTWNRILETTAAALGVRPNIVHIPTDLIARFDPARAQGLTGDKMHSVIIDNTKIKTYVPTFNAAVPFSAGVARTVQWFQADKNRQTIDHEFDALTDRIITAYSRAFSDR